jgi:hypothetical protein
MVESVGPPAAWLVSDGCAVVGAARLWSRSTWPRSRPGSMTSRTRRLSSLVSGKPPSILRSQSVRASREGGAAVVDDDAVSEAEEEDDGCCAWYSMVTTNVPPVLGWRATSPSAAEKVDSSSWANYLVCRLVSLILTREHCAYIYVCVFSVFLCSCTGM